MKSLLSAIPLALSLSAGSFTASAATDQSELKKELEIMTSVMKTAMRQSERRNTLRVVSTDSIYLANQGVVFTFTTSGRGDFFIDLGGLQNLIPDIPMPPNIVFSTDENIEFNIDSDWEHTHEEAMEHVREAFEQTTEKLRDLRSQQRDFSWETRELEREIRDLEFRLRSSTGADKEELTNELKEAQARRKSLEAQQAEVEEYVAKIETEQKQRHRERKEAKTKVIKQFLSDFEQQAGDILCRYGNGMRALDDDENVTFVLENISANEKGKVDRIYVFSHKEIKRCVQNKINTNDLLASAMVYEF